MLADKCEGGVPPPLDRLDLLENGRLLAGSDGARARVQRPSTEELVITGAEFALDHLAAVRPVGGDDDGLGSIRADGSEAFQQIRSPELLAAQGVRQVTKLV